MSDDRQDHQAKADELERELDQMQEQSDRLGEDIEGAGEEWERRKADDGVPGATGEPSETGDEEGEDAGGDTQPTSSAGTGELDFGRALADDGGDGEDG
jgi:hypothetical protein